MVKSDKLVTRLICFGKKPHMEKCMKSVVVAAAALPNCKALLWSVAAVDVNFVEVTMRARWAVKGRLGDRIAARHRVYVIEICVRHPPTDSQLSLWRRSVLSVDVV